MKRLRGAPAGQGADAVHHWLHHGRLGGVEALRGTLGLPDRDPAGHH